MADSLSNGYRTMMTNPASDPADLRLVQGLQACEDWAYEELLQRFQLPIYNLIFRLLPDTSETADITQEVFIKVFRSIPGFRNQASLKTWVYRIAVNEAHNHRRWFSRHRKQEVGLSASPEATNGDEEFAPEMYLADHSPTAFDLMVSYEAKVEVELALAELNPQFREAVVLRDIEEMSYDEVAAVLGCSMGTVKSRILRGRLALEKGLRQRLAKTADRRGEGVWSES